jgi:hypothetical protein
MEVRPQHAVHTLLLFHPKQFILCPHAAHTHMSMSFFRARPRSLYRSFSRGRNTWWGFGSSTGTAGQNRRINGLFSFAAGGAAGGAVVVDMCGGRKSK